MLALTGASAQANDELGRLFFTPERRQLLDHQRQFNVQERTPTEAQTLTINGVVTRSSGKRTGWVNGLVVEENNGASDINVVPMRKNPGHVVVQAGKSAPTSAKVGDTVHSDTGETTDLLHGGRIVIRRSSP